MPARDETKHKKAEKETVTFQEHFRGLFNSSKDAIAFGSMDGELLDVNNSFSKLTGYSKEELLTGKTYQDITPTEYEELEGNILEMLLKTGAPQEFEKEYIRKDGSRVPILLTVFLVKGIDDKPIALAAIIKNITERKKSEEELMKNRDHLEELIEIRTKELKESEEKYRELFEDAPDAYFSIGTDKSIRRCNKAAERLLNYSNEELLNMTASDLYADTKNGWEKALGVFKRFLSGEETYDEELQMKTKDGNHIWISLSVKPVLDAKGKILESRSIVRDITERKQVEQELMIKESAIRSSINAIAISNLKGVLTYVNPSFLTIWGYSSDTEILGKHSRDFWKSKKKADEIIEHIQNTGNWVGELSAQKKDGSNFYVQLSASMIYDINSKPISMLASFIDITDRKKAEKEINSALEEIKRSNTELEQFAYVASHDLQEPLRMVSGFANLLEKRFKDSFDQDARDFIDFIIDGASRMHDLINDLLSFSRIGTQGKVFKTTDMNVVLEATLNNVRISANETNAIITYDPLPVIIADESQMVQLLQNLISNAIKFHGSVAPKIHISGEVKKNEWIFTVRDNGIGIDSKNFARIFVIFQRLYKKGEYSGTGIGLAVCKKIIQRHGGKIWVESELKKGSTFYFTISRNQNGVRASKKEL